MRALLVPLALLLTLPLSGCLGGADEADGLDGGDTAAGAGFVQEESVSWLVPASVACIDPTQVPQDPGPGVAYAVVAVDERTHRAPFQVRFEAAGDVLVQVTFWNEAGESVSGAIESPHLGGDGVLTGTVSEDAVEAHVSACGGTSLSAVYRAGAIE